MERGHGIGRHRKCLKNSECVEIIVWTIRGRLGKGSKGSVSGRS